MTRPASGLQTAGWITAFLFPLAGFIIGCVMASRGEKGEIPIIFVSIAWPLFLIVILSFQSL